MISGLVQILLFQGLGEFITHFFLPLIPGPSSAWCCSPASSLFAKA